jgi:hypothetical protein
MSKPGFVFVALPQSVSDQISQFCFEKIPKEKNSVISA